MSEMNTFRGEVMSTLPDQVVDGATLTGVNTGELIVRQQLMLISGRVTEAARLDPERHPRTSI
jgi:hypothetical protein